MSSSKNEITEIELKLALPSFTDYLKLIGFIGEADAKINQINIFYDTPSSQISKLGFALRLRLESNRGLVTLKSTTIQKGSAAVRKEIEASITLEKAKETEQNNNLLTLDIPPIKFLRSQPGSLKDIQPINRFENERIKKEIILNGNAYVFEIDKTTYSDSTVDYELEIELESLEKVETAESDIQRLFKLLEIEFHQMKKSKFERALEIAKRL